MCGYLIFKTIRIKIKIRSNRNNPAKNPTSNILIKNIAPKTMINNEK
jgi:hypothetical protein